MTELPREGDASPAILSKDDAAALDALVSCGFDPRFAARTIPGGRERLERLSRLLGLLDCNPESDRSLADVTFARLMQARGEKLGSTPRETGLSPADDEALESLVMAGFDASRVPTAMRERARKHHALATLVTHGKVASDDALVDRTLARIQGHIDAKAGAMRIDRRPRRRLGLRLPDLVSAAAVILIGAGVALPILGTMREQSRRTLCSANLGSTASALSSYASSYRDALPVANASLAGGPWWKTGAPQSNSANLFTLPREGYLPLKTLACPGNSRAITSCPAGARDWGCLEEVSYSYQIMFGPQRPAWKQQGRTVVLADRSPIVLQSVRGEPIDPFANAPSHRSAGQHVLHNDGSASWERSPELAGGDNIWLPRSIEAVVHQVTTQPRRRLQPLLGTETPDAADDAFLGP